MWREKESSCSFNVICPAEDVAVSGFGVEDQLAPSTEPVLPLPQQQQQQQRNSPSLINTITLPDGT